MRLLDWNCTRSFRLFQSPSCDKGLLCQEKSALEVVIKVSALKALQECLDFGLQHVIFIPGSKKAILLFEYDVFMALVDGSLATDRGDLIFDSDAARNVNAQYAEDLSAALAKDLHPSNDSYSASGFSGSFGEVPALKKKLIRLDEHSEKTLFSLPKTSNIVAYSSRNLSPALVSVKQYPSLTDSQLIHHLPRRMASKNSAFIRKKPENLPNACIFVPASAACLFPVDTASMKGGNLRFRVECCS